MVDKNGEDTEKNLKDVGDIKSLPAVLKKNTSKIMGVLPSGFDDAEKKDMVRAIFYLAVKAYEEIPMLRNCTPDSILKSIMDAASLGMIPFSKTNECAIIPYGKIAQLQLMYRGVHRLAMNTGLFKNIRIDTVRAGDKFNYEKGFNIRLTHIPLLEPIADRDIQFFYGLYELKDGGRDFVVMARKDMDAHRDKYSKQYKKAKENKNLGNAKWHTEYEAMGLKTILIKLLKYAPKSEKLINQLALDKVIKREIAPEPKDFTKEAEEDFILERQFDAEGSGVYEETEEEKGKKKVKKEKDIGVKETIKGKPGSLVTDEALDHIFAMGKTLHIDDKSLNNKIKLRFKINNVKDMTVAQAEKVFKDLKADIDKLNKEADEIEKGIALQEKREQEARESTKEAEGPEKEEKIEQQSLT
ncbi:MAG: recombinase RecT [Syntrophaceae bacterium]|nr:recombinase RecT [Syntrophaceae bacterium]